MHAAPHNRTATLLLVGALANDVAIACFVKPLGFAPCFDSGGLLFGLLVGWVVDGTDWCDDAPLPILDEDVEALIHDVPNSQSFHIQRYRRAEAQLHDDRELGW